MARERLGLTLEELGSEFGITRQAVANWEGGDNKPSFEKLPLLADALKVPIRWLLAGSGPPPAADNLEALTDALSAAQRAWVIAMLETFPREQPPERKTRQRP